jgi:hypothetical protein
MLTYADVCSCKLTYADACLHTQVWDPFASPAAVTQPAFGAGTQFPIFGTKVQILTQKEQQQLPLSIPSKPPQISTYLRAPPVLNLLLALLVQTYNYCLESLRDLPKSLRPFRAPQGCVPNLLSLLVPKYKY